MRACGSTSPTSWRVDLASPGLIKMMKKSWGRNVLDAGFRLNRTFPMAKFFRFIGNLMPARKQAEVARFSGIALLERTAR